MARSSYGFSLSSMFFPAISTPVFVLPMNNFSIRTKFAIPLLFIIVLFLLVGVSSLMNTRSLTADVKEVTDTFLSATSITLNADRDLYQAQVAMLNYLNGRRLGTSDGAAEKAAFKENADQAEARMKQALTLMRDYPQTTSSARDFEEEYADWRSLSEEVFKLGAAGQFDTAARLNSERVNPQFEVVRTNYDVLGEQIEKIADQVTSEAEQAEHLSSLILLGLFVIALGASLISAIFGPRLVTTRVEELDRMIGRISDGDGDLTSRLDTQGGDELSHLAGTFNDLMTKLQNMIGLVKKDVERLNGTADNLSESANRSHAVTNDQGSNLEQIATAVEEMTEALKEVASNSQIALEQTIEAKTRAHDSSGVVKQSVDRIEQLSNSIQHASSVIEALANDSKKIVKVLDVIRDIAEQTNLLALNAAIEAARAGDQGRGFAVVADEVRTLASRTQQSTEDIHAMISGLEKGVQEAVSAIQTGSTEVTTVVELSEDVTRSLAIVDDAVNQTNQMIDYIASATEQQSVVIGDVAESLAVLNDLSGHNIQISDSNKANAKEIDQIAMDLELLVGKFRT